MPHFVANLLTFFVVVFTQLFVFMWFPFFALSLILDMLFRTDKESPIKAEFHVGDSTSNKVCFQFLFAYMCFTLLFYSMKYGVTIMLSLKTEHFKLFSIQV